MRRAIEQNAHAPAPVRLTVEQAGARYIDHLEALGRKRSTIIDYRSVVKQHLAPFFGDRALHRTEGSRDPRRDGAR